MKKPHRRKQPEAPPAARSGVTAPAPPVRLRRSVALFLILLPSLLVLWRLVLLEPLQALSRGAIQGVFSLLPFPGSRSAELITVDSNNGDWVVHASLLLWPEREITVQLAGAHEAGVRVQPVMLQCFSLCLPIFWALALAVWPGKQLFRESFRYRHAATGNYFRSISSAVSGILVRQVFRRSLFNMGGVLASVGGVPHSERGAVRHSAAIGYWAPSETARAGVRRIFSANTANPKSMIRISQTYKCIHSNHAWFHWFR